MLDHAGAADHLLAGVHVRDAGGLPASGGRSFAV